MPITHEGLEKVFGEGNHRDIETTVKFSNSIEKKVTNHLIDKIKEVPKEELKLEDESSKEIYKRYFLSLMSPDIKLNDYSKLGSGGAYELNNIDRISLVTENQQDGPKNLFSISVDLEGLPTFVEPEYSSGKIEELSTEEDWEEWDPDFFGEFRYTFAIEEEELLKEVPFEEYDRFFDAVLKYESQSVS